MRERQAVDELCVGVLEVSVLACDHLDILSVRYCDDNESGSLIPFTALHHLCAR